MHTIEDREQIRKWIEQYHNSRQIIYEIFSEIIFIHM